MTKQQLKEDLFLAVRRYLINEGRNEELASTIALKMYAKCEHMKVKHIKRIRDIFIG